MAGQLANCVSLYGVFDLVIRHARCHGKLIACHMFYTNNLTYSSESLAILWCYCILFFNVHYIPLIVMLLT